MMITSADKRLNEMDDLRDMGRFPTPIYVGATGNILQTILLTYLLHGRTQSRTALPLWAGAIIAANVGPVIALRQPLDEHSSYPPIGETDFFADQHKFASWVYAVASANMLIWITFAWIIFDLRRSPQTLCGVLTVALLATFLPAWIRPFVRR
jgi:hypothetical protein